MFWRKKKNPVCAIYWRDAAYTSEKELPALEPPIQVTVGFVISATDEYTNIATNVRYDEKTKTLKFSDNRRKDVILT